MNSSDPKSPIIELHYLPSIEFFSLLHKDDLILLEAHENYVKQSYRNRCYILGANGKLQLTVPVVGGRKKIPIRDIQIDQSQNWLNIHIRALKSAYGKAPFFEFYFDYFDNIFQKREKFLFDLNLDLLTVCLNMLGIQKSIKLSESYSKPSEGRFSDFRNQITSKSDFTSRTFYQPVRYNQVFGKDFVPNLSVVDLIMNEGPNSGTIIQKSAV